MKAIASILATTIGISSFTAMTANAETETSPNAVISKVTVADTISEGRWNFTTDVITHANGLIEFDIQCKSDNDNFCGYIGDITLSTPAVAEMYHDGAGGRSMFDHVGCGSSTFTYDINDETTTYSLSFEDSGEGKHFGGYTLMKMWLYTNRDYLDKTQTINVFGTDVVVEFTKSEVDDPREITIKELNNEINDLTNRLNDCESEINKKNELIAELNSKIIELEAKYNDVMLGDVNCDNNVNISDAVLLQKWILGSIDSLPKWQNADMNKDEKIDVFDLCLLKRQIVEKIA